MGRWRGKSCCDLQHFYDDLAFACGDSAATAAFAAAAAAAAWDLLRYIAIKSCDISAIFQAARACVQVSKPELTRWDLQNFNTPILVPIPSPVSTRVRWKSVKAICSSSR